MVDEILHIRIKFRYNRPFENGKLERERRLHSTWRQHQFLNFQYKIGNVMKNTRFDKATEPDT